STAADPQGLLTDAGGFEAGTGTPSRFAPPAPVTSHRQTAGLPALVLVRLMAPLRGLPPNDTGVGVTTEGAPGVKSAVTGASPTTIVCCTTSLETPSSTCSCTR